MQLEGKVALVTGGTGVIGNAIARGLAFAGADVIIVARRRQPLEQAAEELAAASGQKIVALTADVGDRSSVDRLLDDAADAFAGIDVLVNNTFSIGGEQPIVDLDVDDWDEPWRVNVMGPFQLSKGCARRMMAGRGGSIVNILTTAAFLPLSPWRPTG